MALLVQAALLLWRLDRLPVWGDEQFTLDVVAMPWNEIAGTLRRDIHPPLYFVLAKLWASLPLPGTEIVRLRAFSALTMLGATVVVDRLILARRPETARRWTLAVWALAPAVVLYGRMARSYALQTLLAVFALYAAMRLIAAPSRRRNLLAGCALAALLYTHYLPGLAVTAALGLAAVHARRLTAAGAALAVAVLAYAPWAVVLIEGIGRAANKDVYAISGYWFAELPVRAAYTALGLFAGEAHNLFTFGFAAALCLGLSAALWMGWRAEQARWMLGTAAAVGFLGAAQWVSFPFMPARLLWLLPWLALLAVAGALRLPRPRIGLGAWLALLVLGQVFHAQQRGFLNKAYLIPFGQIAANISPGDVVLADATNCDPAPLRAALPAASYRAIAAEGDIEPALRFASKQRGIVWRVRASRDVTPERIQDQIDHRLREAGFRRSEQGLLPYSSLDLALLRVIGENHPPAHHLQLIRFERDAR